MNDEIDVKEFGNKVKRLREERGMSQGDLADKLFISRKIVSKWETGYVLPSVELLISLSKVFDVSLEELLLSKSDKKTSSNELSVFPPYRLTRIFVSAVVLVILFFLLVYFASTFNKFRVYSISSQNAQMTGNYVIAKNRRIFNINSVKLSDNSLDSKKFYDIQYKVMLNDDLILSVGDISQFRPSSRGELKSLKDYIEDISVYIIDDLPNFANPVKNDYSIKINYIDENNEEKSYIIKFKMNEFFANNQLLYENYEI